MKQHVLSFFFVLIIAAACAAPPSLEPTSEPTATEVAPIASPTAAFTETPLPTDTPEPTLVPSETPTPEPTLTPTWEVFAPTTPSLPPNGESLPLAAAPPLLIVNETDERLVFILVSPHYNEFVIYPDNSLRVRIWPGSYTFLAALESVVHPGTFVTKIEKLTIYVELDRVRVVDP